MFKLKVLLNILWKIKKAIESSNEALIKQTVAKLEQSKGSLPELAFKQVKEQTHQSLPNGL